MRRLVQAKRAINWLGRFATVWLIITLGACAVRLVMELPGDAQWSDTLAFHAVAGVMALLIITFPKRPEPDGGS